MHKAAICSEALSARPVFPGAGLPALRCLRLSFVPMNLIDTHAHIYLPEFAADLDAVLETALVAGVEQVLLPAIDSSTHAAMLQLEAAHPHCRSMIGLHPCSVTADPAAELAIVENLLKERAFIGVGEIGLDFYWDISFREQQYAAFHRQIALALQYGLPIAIHSRNATQECIEVVLQYPELEGVFHCFSGTAGQAMQLIGQSRFYLGIGGVLTFKNGGLDKLVQETGLDRLVLETDAPYLAPVPYRGKRNEPAYTALVAAKLASLLDLPLAEIARVTTENAKKLFRLS